MIFIISDLFLKILKKWQIPLSVVPCNIKGRHITRDYASEIRTSATAAEDDLATVQQLMELYGLQNQNMRQEYVSTSKAAVSSIAQKLQEEQTKKEEGTMIDKKDEGLLITKTDEQAGGTLIDKWC